MNTDESPMYGWNTIRWKKVERIVFKLQKRIYRAQQRGEVRKVRLLQRLLMRSRSAKLLAVRRVTQDNQGKRTAGVDGIKSLTPKQRLELVEKLGINQKAKPVRRVWIDKPGTEEKRPLGIPTIHDRAVQSLVKSALEPEWEAKFEPNSYGFRSGRSAWDAIGAIYVNINLKPKWVLDADIAKCYDRINHKALLSKINASPTIMKQIKYWLKAGVMEQGELFPTTEGTPQGGIVSPLLANIALDGMERVIQEAFPRKRNCPRVIRYADDLVVLDEKREVVERCQEIITEWLKGMGLELKPSKTRIIHTLQSDGEAGFNFLGFNVRQYPVSKRSSGINPGNRERLGFKTIIKPSKESVKKHNLQLSEVIDQHKTAKQVDLIKALGPIIKGWANYFSTVCSKETYQKMDGKLLNKLRAWIGYRHPTKSRTWANRKYWKREENKVYFSPKQSNMRLIRHSDTLIKRHVKIEGKRSPYDGDWIYWSSRMGRHPGVSNRVAILLKKQKGKCLRCGLNFRYEDLLEVDHIIPKEYGGMDAYYNWQLLHRHCHDEKTREDRLRCA